jgi:putative ABC transport system permease protein
VVQNIISVVALICTFTVMRQLRFIETADIGFEKENIITVELRDPLIRKNPSALINELRQNRSVVDITTSATLPVTTLGTTYASWEDKPEEVKQFVYRAGIGNNFMDFYGLKLIAGRGFSDNFPSDTIKNYIINETAARITGLDDPVGRKFGFNKESGLGTIIGVVEDFHFQSLHLPIEPLALASTGNDNYSVPRYISVKVTPGSLSATLTFINGTLREFSPHYLNRVSVFSDRLDNMYRSERKLATMFIFASVLALLLTCLGQFGLASFTTRSRTREMVVRKVMGAQPSDVMVLITVQMAKWIFVSLLFAWPASYFLMTGWLRNYAYHVPLGAGVFLLSLALILLISVLAISYHIVKLSRVNPAETLRHE